MVQHPADGALEVVVDPDVVVLRHRRPSGEHDGDAAAAQLGAHRIALRAVDQHHAVDLELGPALPPAGGGLHDEAVAVLVRDRGGGLHRLREVRDLGETPRDRVVGGDRETEGPALPDAARGDVAELAGDRAYVPPRVL
ncbi:hypothetical protein [Nonomuraea aridisoli]|uniref:hypothetical protein n=1 Tax=Nonomuraea aridisoli TaxID=2070368 RepID=UPI0011B936FA|nr:hypothetical protein [Nonomuraea aridisoli]